MTALLDPDTIDKLARHTDDLAIIADWKAELLAKIDRAQMRLELVGLDREEQDLLADEVQIFKGVCRALMATRMMTAASSAPTMRAA